MVLDHDDANDLVQETFLKVWKNLSQFREESKLFTWIYRISTNETLSFLNKKKRKFMLPIFDYTNQLSKNLEDDNFFTGDEIQKKLQKAILRLPAKQKRAIIYLSPEVIIRKKKLAIKPILPNR